MVLQGLLAPGPTFLFAALEDTSLRLCRAEALAALGRYSEALQDLEAVCRAEPMECKVSRGGQLGVWWCLGTSPHCIGE